MNLRELKWLSSLQTKLQDQVAELINEDILFKGMYVYSLNQVSIEGEEIRIEVNVETLKDRTLTSVQSRLLLSEFVKLGRTEDEVEEVEEDFHVNRSVIMQMARDHDDRAEGKEPMEPEEPQLKSMEGLDLDGDGYSSPSVRRDRRTQVAELLRGVEGRASLEMSHRDAGYVKSAEEEFLAGIERNGMWAKLNELMEDE